MKAGKPLFRAALVGLILMAAAAPALCASALPEPVERAGAGGAPLGPMAIEVPAAGLALGAAPRVAAIDAGDLRWAANGANQTPPATISVESVGARLSGSRVLAPYSVLALRLTVSEGDSIIFQADSPRGESQLFDCYLFNAQNYTLYSTLREGGDPNATVAFFNDYTSRSTDHAAFTTEPLPAGTYFVVLDNDERLSQGATPVGNVTVTFAVAVANNSVPIAALVVIVAGAAAAVYATVRWRPVFDARSPLMVMDGDDDADVEAAAGSSPSDMDEGEGPPPHPP